MFVVPVNKALTVVGSVVVLENDSPRLHSAGADIHIVGVGYINLTIMPYVGSILGKYAAQRQKESYIPIR
jgi:hypothetical protein